MSRYAILLAGGLGSRLHPLTQDLPKPMVPILGKPWLEWLLERLNREGWTAITLSLHYGKDHIMEYFASWKEELRFVVEPELLGTAGALRYALPDEGDRFLVLNADIVHSFPLQPLWDFHKARGAQATIGLVEVEDPSAFGSVQVDGEGRVRAFREKPKAGEAVGRWVNAGIYIFERSFLETIPWGERRSLERDVFPRRLAEGVKIYGLPLEGYWQDIGTRDRYLKLHQDILKGTCPLEIPALLKGPSLWQGEGVRVEKGARVFPPVVLGEGTWIEEGAQVGPWTVTGRGVRIRKGATVVDSVLWDRVEVARGATIRRSVVGVGAQVEGPIQDGLVAAGSR
ncbi:MAG: NDP-sugar synthase [Bacillota bacterium]|nr:NDP-sugar synthase [Bacillota bacterium]